MASGNFTMGSEVSKFEDAFSEFIGVEHSIMVNSGSSANLALLAGLKYMKDSALREGDEVIVPTVSWSTTFYPVQQMGFVLRFVDISRETFNIDVDLVEKAITPRTRVIFAVNLLGNPCDFKKLEDIASSNNLILIEDNCESLGAKILGKRTGSFGLGGTHSFFFSHHMCTMEGGMVTTNDSNLAETIKSLRAHGWIRGLPESNSIQNHSDNQWENLFRFYLPGYNLRPLEMEGAVGSVQLQKLPEFIENRRANAQKFKNLFENSLYYDIQIEEGESSWFGFGFILKGSMSGKRRALIAYLEANQIETRPIVAGNFLNNPVIKHLPHNVYGDSKVAQDIDENGFFVGNHHFEIEQNLEQLKILMDKFISKETGEV
jgi:CDP-6-deoxy-D-xylo-4-hexulose-3-dehydrase